MTAKYEVHALGPWTDPVTENRSSCAPFKAKWQSTLDLLESEADNLQARLVVLDVAVEQGDIRLDGMLRANAKVGFPGVRVHLIGTRFGDLVYATDRYESRYFSDSHSSWQANVRAIALSLEALRAVDRYGVSNRGEQYAGWKALPAGGSQLATQMTRDVAAGVLEQLAEMSIDFGNHVDVGVAFRRARAAAHPDRNNGDRGAWDRVEQAGRVLGLVAG